MADLRYVKELKVLSYNMRGFNQGRVAMDDLIATVDPDVLLRISVNLTTIFPTSSLLAVRQ